jgi:TPR repeat protein
MGDSPRMRRLQQDTEVDAEPAPMNSTAHPTLPLPLLSVGQMFFSMCVSVQLCNAQGAALVPFVRLLPRVCHPFADTRVYSMSLMHGERLRVVGCRLTGKLVRLMSLGTGRNFEPARNWRACCKLLHYQVRRVAAKLMHLLAATVGNNIGNEAEELYASGQCAAAAVALKLAVYLGHLPSRALMAHMLIDGREGVAKNMNAAFKLVEDGARFGCHHCQGVMAHCYWGGYGCVEDESRSLELAHQSSGKGSKYGQCMLGRLYNWGEGGVAEDRTEALALYQLAAAQNLDEAQWSLGRMYCEIPHKIQSFTQDYAEALRFYQLAAAQGHPFALFSIAECHERGWAVRQNMDEAIRWYRRALAAGASESAAALVRLLAWA